MRILIPLLFILSFSETSLSQTGEVFSLKLRPEAVDENYRKTQAITPVFKYTGQPMEGIAEFGLKTSKKHTPETFEIIFPDMQGIRDTAYTFLFFGANKTQNPVGYVFCLIGNSNRRYPYTLLWVDRNMNLDLSDDGAPDTFFNTNPNEFIHIKLYHPQVKTAFHLVQLTRFDAGQNIQYKKLLNEHYEKNSGNKVFAGADNSFREQRINLRSADFKNGNDSFRIAIRDENSNGIFNEKDFDQILLGNYGQEELGEIVFEADKKGFYFEWNFKQYRITKIESDGTEIQFYHDAQAHADRQLKIGKKLPKFKVTFANPEAKKVKIRKFKGKPLFVYFFNFSSPDFENDLVYLKKIHEEFGNEIRILALNYGDAPRKVFGWTNINKIPFETGVVTQKILKQYHVYSVPTSYLTNKKLRLCEINVNSQQLYEHLKNKTQK